jgi:hypothetical protein
MKLMPVNLHILSLLFEIHTFTGKALLRGTAVIFSGSVFTGEDAVSVSELGDSVSDTVSFMKQICRFIPKGVKDTTSVNITVTEETKIYIRKLTLQHGFTYKVCRASKHSTCSFTYAVRSAPSCISVASHDKTKNHTEMWFELTCDEGSELFVCVVVTLDKCATYWPNKDNKAST